MNGRLSLLLLAVTLLIVPLSAQSAEIDLASGQSVAFAAPDEAIVFLFPAEVSENAAQRGITAAQGRQDLAVRIRVAGSRVVIQPDTRWPVDTRVTIDIADVLRAGARGTRLPASVTVAIEDPDRFQPVADKANRGEIQVVDTGNLDNGVEVFPLPFTPNNDGFNDVLHITRLEGGFTDPKVNIFSIDGVLLADLDSAALIRGEIIWDGSTRLGQEARPGPYFIIVEDAGDVLASGVIYILR